MNDQLNRTTKALKRGHQFVLDHPINPPNALLTAAQTALATAIEQIDTIAGERETGTGRARGAVVERRLRQKALRSTLAVLALVARTLDPIAHPDIAAQLRMGRLGSFAALIAHTKSVIGVITPIKQLFVERGAAPTLVEDLQAQLDAFTASVARRFSGLGTQVGKGLALKEAVRIGQRHLRTVDGILTQLLKPNPEKLGEWKAAKRVKRPPKKKAKVPVKPTPPLPLPPARPVVTSSPVAISTVPATR